MPTELNDDEARRLLARAAGTIQVGDAAPMTLTGLPEPPRHRWVAVVAVAAAVALVAGIGYGAARLVGDEPNSSEQVADGPVVEMEHLFAEDEVPSVLGYTRREAVELLESKGLEVKIGSEYDCEQPRGYVVSSTPGPGAPLEPGGSVGIRVLSGPPPGVRCAGPLRQMEEVWHLIRFARGLAPQPDLPGEIALAAGDERFVTISADEAADPSGWTVCSDGVCHSALAALAEMLTRPTDTGSFVVATGDLGLAGNREVCLTGDPHEEVATYHSETYVYVDRLMDGEMLCPPAPVLQIEWTEDRRIASVRLRLSPLDPDDIAPDPSEPDPRRREAGRAFADWARGNGPAPEFADEVQLLVSDHPTAELTAEQAADLPSGPACPRFISVPCRPARFSPLAVIDQDWHPVVQTLRPEGRSGFCSRETSDLPADLEEAVADDMVELSQPEPKSCGDAYRVELWVDDDGAIYAINLAVSPRKGPLPRP